MGKHRKSWLFGHPYDARKEEKNGGKNNGGSLCCCRKFLAVLQGNGPNMLHGVAIAEVALASQGHQSSCDLWFCCHTPILGVQVVMAWSCLCSELLGMGEILGSWFKVWVQKSCRLRQRGKTTRDGEQGYQPAGIILRAGEL